MTAHRIAFSERVLRAIGVAVLAGALTACGGTVGGSATGAEVARSIESIAADANKAMPTTRPAGEPTTVDAPSASDGATGGTEPAPLTVTVGKTGWHEGFAVTAQEATATGSYGGAEVEISLTYENIGRTAGYAPRGSVEVAGMVGTSVDDITSDEVPAGATGKGTITVAVDGPAPGGTVDLQKAIDSVVLVYGEQGDNRTLIPLAADQPVDSIEPRHLDVTGTLAQSSVTIEVVNGILTPSWVPGEAGKMVIDLQIKVSCAAGCRASGFYSDRDYFTLTDAAGTKLGAEQARSGYCCEAIYPATVVQGDNSTLAFVVEQPGTGSYTLTYEDPTVSAEGSPAGSLTFNV